MASIGGNGKPKFLIYTIDGNKIDELLLDLTTYPEGLTEEYEYLEDYNHEFYDLSTDIKFDSFHIYFSLSYSEFSSNENTLKIRKLNQYITSNKKIVLIPRIDVEFVRYEVIPLKDNKIKKNVLVGGSNAKGNKISNLQFRTKYPQKNWQWYDPSNLYVMFDFDDFAIV